MVASAVPCALPIAAIFIAYTTANHLERRIAGYEDVDVCVLGIRDLMNTWGVYTFKKTLDFATYWSPSNSNSQGFF